VAGGQPTEKLLEVLDLLLDQLPDGATGAMAQEPGRVYRLGGVSSSPTNAPQFAAMFDALRRLGFIMGSTGSREFVALQDAARARGVELLIHQIVRAEEITPAIDAAKASGAAALNVLSSPFLYGNRQIVMQRVAAQRLPAIYQFPEEAEEGGFVAYGPRIVQIFRELVTEQLVKLLRGAKPADIPVEQPTKFELMINLKTASAMGITVPATLVARADKVIE
jgi:putative tryptophan/tyrosine transport system substrate-binding protein